MALYMPDAVNVNDLPVGYPAYAGYVDGEFPTATQLVIMFPDAQLVLLTVNGASAAAHGARVSSGADDEPGDLTAVQAVDWAAWALQSTPARTPGPVIYASAEGQPGYGMQDVLAALEAMSIDRGRVRLWSAHWTGSPHVCGPATCKAISVPMDGTQFTNDFKTSAGAVIDMSLLEEDFFGTPPAPAPKPAPTETEKLVQQLGTVRQGDTGPMVRTVQGLCNARIADTEETHIPMVTLDGIFGADTLDAVKSVQSWHKLTDDGIVGPLTWPVLLGIA